MAWLLTTSQRLMNSDPGCRAEFSRLLTTAWTACEKLMNQNAPLSRVWADTFKNQVLSIGTAPPWLSDCQPDAYCYQQLQDQPLWADIDVVHTMSCP